MSDPNQKYEQAKKIAMTKLDFIRHAIIYVLIMILLAVVNNTTFSSYQWWIWPAIGWGIGIISHFMQAFVFQSGIFTKKMIQNEMERMDGE